MNRPNIDDYKLAGGGYSQKYITDLEKHCNELEKAIEMCDECAKKLNKLISDNFAFIYSADYEQDLHIEKATKEKE